MLLYNFASKAGLEQSDAEDVVADTVFIVSKAIGEFDYDRKKGKFRSWLHSIARNQLANHYRRRSRTPLGSEADQLKLSEFEGAGTESFEAIWNEEWQRHIMDMALNQLKTKTSARQFQLFHSHVMRNRNCDDAVITAGQG